MRILRLAMLMLGLVLIGESSTQAQVINNDPFNLYYGWYLPQQAALSARPRPINDITNLTAARQQTASTQRATLFDPMAGYGLSNTLDPAQLFPDRAASGGRSPRRGGGLAIHGTSIDGSGPGIYYNRASSYFPGLRAGRGPSAASVASGSTMPSRGGSRMGMGAASMFNPNQLLNPNPTLR